MTEFKTDDGTELVIRPKSKHLVYLCLRHGGGAIGVERVINKKVLRDILRWNLELWASVNLDPVFCFNKRFKSEEIRLCADPETRMVSIHYFQACYLDFGFDRILEFDKFLKCGVKL